MTPSDSPGPKMEGGGVNANSAQLSFTSTDRVIVNFVPKFVAMATGVGREEIWITPSESRARKQGTGANSAKLSFTGAELWSILSKNLLPWQRGSAGKKF